MSYSSPLDHNSIDKVVSRSEQEASMADGSVFRLQTFNVIRRLPMLMSEKNPEGLVESVIRIVTVIAVGEMLKRRLTDRGRKQLLNISGVWTCGNCKTSEYVRSNERFNAGHPTCQRCQSTTDHWEANE